MDCHIIFFYISFVIFKTQAMSGNKQISLGQIKYIFFDIHSNLPSISARFLKKLQEPSDKNNITIIQLCLFML